MSQGLILFGLLVLFMLGGLLAFWRSAKSLPKKLPPPLKDEERNEDDAWR